MTVGRSVTWMNRQARIWWPLLAAMVGGAILAALGFVVATVVEDRAQLREQRDLLAEQSEQLALIIERGQRADAGAEERLQDAIREVEQLLAAQFAEHDFNTATKLNDTLAQIAALLGRPAGVPVDPVTAHPVPSGHNPPTASAPPAASERPPATSTTAPPATTTTTSPGQSGLCERNPTARNCRSNP